MNDTPHKDDILGLKPYGEALNTTVQKTFQALEFFLSSTCKPALDEIGLMIGDKFRVWRLNNVAKILQKSRDKYQFVDGEIQLTANPKVALTFIESASYEDNEELQDLWAGLFASACKKDRPSDEEMIYINLLKQLTLSEAKLLKTMCESAEKYIGRNGNVISKTMSKNFEELKAITGLSDMTSIEAVLNHLHSLRLNNKENSTNPAGFLSDSDRSIT